LAEDVVAGFDVPSFDRSAMDGFAVRSTDTASASRRSPVRLSIGGESRAGHQTSGVLAPREAIRISTGAAIPAGADAVVRVEDTIDSGGILTVSAPVGAGANIRDAGEDLIRGQLALSKGTVVDAGALGVLASIGQKAAPCVRRPRVGLLTTGDELTEVGAVLSPGSVYDINSWTLSALLTEAGAELVTSGPIGDDPHALRAAITTIEHVDLLVVCGGVSVGAHDHVKDALARTGFVQRFWRVAMRPGSPTWFGVRDGEDEGRRALAFGLPGNPSAAMITAMLFVLPALAALEGMTDPPTRLRARFDAAYAKRPGVVQAVCCRLHSRDDGWHALPTGHGHGISRLVGVDALALIEAERADISRGELVTVQLVGRPRRAALR
jgi:molybdopterin molybdotransferase